MERYSAIPLSAPDGQVFEVECPDGKLRRYAWVDHNLYMLVPTESINNTPCKRCRDAASV